jgi:hypothetical protein
VNNGILTQLRSPPPAPYGLLGAPVAVRMPGIPIHPEALDWASRVAANGGLTNLPTIRAVSRLCNRIDAAGLRSKIYRMSLLCGDDYSAALVPLYRNTSPSLDAIGGATDTGVNTVSGDYSATGSSGGIKGNQSSKYLDTGLSPTALPTVATLHLSVWIDRSSDSTRRGILGAEPTGQTPNSQRFFIEQGGSNGWFSLGLENSNVPVPNQRFLVASRTAATSAVSYGNGSVVGSLPNSVTPATNTSSWFLMARNVGGTASVHSGQVFSAYSIGDGLTGPEVYALYDAIDTFRKAIGRP